MTNKTTEALKLSREIILHLLENHPTARHHRKTGEALSAIDAAIEEHETVECESCGETILECQIAGETESGGVACTDCVVSYLKDRATALECRATAIGWALYCVECWEKSNGDPFAASGKPIDHIPDATKMFAPEGYALISIEALKAWGKYDEVRSACRFPAEPMNRPQNCGTGYCSCIECPYEPVKQEPVAWAYIDADGSFMDALDRQHGAYQTPLYAAPVSAKREWVDLTDDEIDLIEQQVYCRTTQKGRPLGVYAVELVRAVITAFKEKNT